MTTTITLTGKIKSLKKWENLGYVEIIASVEPNCTVTLEVPLEYDSRFRLNDIVEVTAKISSPEPVFVPEPDPPAGFKDMEDYRKNEQNWKPEG